MAVKSKVSDGPLRVQAPGDVQRVAGAVQEVGVAEGDVTRARRDLRADVGQHHVRRHHEEPAAVDGHDRAVPAQVQAAAAGLDVGGGIGVAVVLVSRVPRRRRQRRAVGDRERTAARARGGPRRPRGHAGHRGRGAPRAERAHEIDQRVLALAGDDRVRGARRSSASAFSQA